MFYAHVVLAKKGPLARIWLAAHWDKKLTKAHVFETNIEQSIDGIMQPKVKLALRTSGHLLLGVVRIYSRKAKYLLADCNEAFVKIKMAFRPGIVDLPEEHREAAVNAITLPEVFHDFDTALPELNDVDIEAQFSINQSRADEITMREDYGMNNMNIHDDGFGDMAFDGGEPHDIRDANDDYDEGFLTFQQDMHQIDSRSKDDPMPGTSGMNLELHSNEGFGDEFDQPAAGLFEGDIFSEAPAPRQTALPEIPPPAEESDDDDGHFDDGAPSPIGSSDNSRAGSPMPASSLNQLLETEKPLADEGGPSAGGVLDDIEEQEKENLEPNVVAPIEEESFALAPVDSSLVKGFSNKSKRKRKLIIDEVKNISGDEMKSQLANTADIVTTLDLAPPTKRLMFWKETGGVEKLFALPSRELPNVTLFKNYQRHLVTTQRPVEDFSRLGPAELLIVAEHHPAEEIASPVVKRRRKQRSPEPQLPPPASQQQQLQPPPTPVAPETPAIAEQVSELADSIDMIRHESVNKQQPSAFDLINQTPVNQASFMSNQTPTNNEPVPPTPQHVSSVFDTADGFTPMGLDHGGMTPSHVMDNIEPFPNLPVDQVSSILNAGYTNLGYDNGSGLDDKISHDWDGDYDFPPSVGAANADDQQGVDETVEQFEERVLNKRAAALFVNVRGKLQKQDSICLSEMTHRNNKKQAAQKFYSLLVLKKFQALNLHQTEPYADIQITRGAMFENPTL